MALGTMTTGAIAGTPDWLVRDALDLRYKDRPGRDIRDYAGQMDPRIVKEADRIFHEQHPELDGQRVGMGKDHYDYRKDWMDTYEALVGGEPGRPDSSQWSSEPALEHPLVDPTTFIGFGIKDVLANFAAGLILDGAENLLPFGGSSEWTAEDQRWHDELSWGRHMGELKNIKEAQEAMQSPDSSDGDKKWAGAMLDKMQSERDQRWQEIEGQFNGESEMTAIEAEIQRANENIESNSAEMEQIQAQLTEIDNHIGYLNDKIAWHDQKINTLKQEVYESQQKLNELKKSQKGTEQEIKDLESYIEDCKGDIKYYTDQKKGYQKDLKDAQKDLKDAQKEQQAVAQRFRHEIPSLDGGPPTVFDMTTGADGRVSGKMSGHILHGDGKMTHYTKDLSDSFQW